MKKQIIRMIFVSIIALFMSQAVSITARTFENSPQQSVESQLNKIPSNVPPEEKKLTGSSFSPTDGEPLLLLLFGLAVFVAATTIKKRSNTR